MKKPPIEPVEKLWEDRKRHLGLPISFVKYSLSEDRLFVETGVLFTREEEVVLYRVKDLTLTRTLWQRLCRVGTVCVKSSDSSVPHLDLKNVAHPKEVKELIHQKVEAAKLKHGVRATEIVDGSLTGAADSLHGGFKDPDGRNTIHD